MIHGFSQLITRVFDIIVLPFAGNPTLALSGVSLLCGIAMIFIFRATSDQTKIRRARDLFKARILEMRLYQDDLVLIFRALGRALATNLLYLRVSFKPIVVLVLFVLLIFIQLDERYSRSPLKVGDATLITVTLKDGADITAVPMSLLPSEGMTTDAPPVRIPSRSQINWRVRINKEGQHTATVNAYQSTYQLPIIAEDTKKPLGSQRQANSRIDALIHPSLPPIPGNSPISSISLTYPAARYSLLGWHTHWLVLFIFWSFVGALVPKFLFNIEV